MIQARLHNGTTMAPATPRGNRFGLDEGLALALALALHAGLAAVFIFAEHGRQPVPPPERMTVSLTEDVALTSTSPDPRTAASAHVAPTLGETHIRPAPPEPRPVVQPAPAPTVQPRAVSRPATRAPARQAPKPASKPLGGARIGDDFLKGIGGDSPRPSRGAPAANFGSKEVASLSSAISRQIKSRGKWSLPSGVDSDKLVTVVAFDLNPDGTLKSRPQLVSQSGETEANAAQKARHAENAIRAVQLAAPFDLPEEHYRHWKRVRSFRFDWKF